MKKYQFELPKSISEIFFPKLRMKDKAQMLLILLEATRHMLFASKSLKDEKEKIVLQVDKMSRLFFFKENKYYSIVFPFNVYENETKLRFTFNDEYEIDSQLISNVISIITSDSFDFKCSLDFAEPIYEIENDFDDNFWTILRELLLIEVGYIRYDKDEIGHKKAKDEGEEHRHPLNHYDIFYSNKASFKLGLTNEISDEDFIDLLNTKTDCKYLKKWS